MTLHTHPCILHWEDSYLKALLDHFPSAYIYSAKKPELRCLKLCTSALKSQSILQMCCFLMQWNLPHVHHRHPQEQILYCRVHKKTTVILMWASALCIRLYNNPAPVIRSMQFHYCTVSNPGTGADHAFVLKRCVLRNATWPSHSRPAIAAGARHFQICFLP